MVLRQSESRDSDAPFYTGGNQVETGQGGKRSSIL